MQYSSVPSEQKAFKTKLIYTSNVPDGTKKLALQMQGEFLQHYKRIIIPVVIFF
jgi:hypothetical protein